MQFYKLCDKWQVEVDKNPEALKELENFKTKPIVTRMLENISQRIGMTNRFKFGLYNFTFCGILTIDSLTTNLLTIYLPLFISIYLFTH